MAAPPPTEASSHFASTSDLEIRAAKIADPNVDLRTKHLNAVEIREILDTIRDAESVRALPYLIPAILDLIRTGDVSQLKDSLEFQFRRVLLEIINRLPINETIRAHTNAIFGCMLHVLRHDNEENGSLAGKTILDLVRGYRVLTEEHVNEFAGIFQEGLRNMAPYVTQVLSEDSVAFDTNTVSFTLRSCKVIGEMSMTLVIMSQINRPIVVAPMQATIGPAFEALALESQAQKKAREDHEAMGGTWAGMVSTIKNPSAYSDFIHSQIKILSYLAYVMRFAENNSDETYGERLLVTALRMLQDCPADGIALRKELMVVFRHLMTLPARTALFPYLDKLFDENVLLGSRVGSKEMLRPVVYSAVADLVHHIRNDLTPTQIGRVVHMYSRIIHNPALGNSLHTMSAKMIFGLTEPIITKETPQEAARLLGTMFETCLQRMEALALVYDEVQRRVAALKDNSEQLILDAALIEKARPVGGAIYALEKPDEIVQESRLMFRSLLHGFRVCLGALRKCDAILDGRLYFRLFEGCVRCFSFFDPDPRGPELSDSLEWFGSALLELNLHVFQEVWTHKMEFFFESASKRPVLLNICQFLLAKDATSPTLLAIVLNFLVDRLHLLGEADDLTAAATIRLFKMTFGAVTTLPALNEPILKMHLAKLLMDCFPLAAQATKPTNYFHLLRALFRAIGGGGGRFELLYTAVLPLLPDLLESLNRQLHACEGHARDMIVELCLTVPLRLTHLLPHLSYLMQPLALALKGSPELVSQGLRTLELCIDNLTPDFLDPTLSIVLRELMEALHSHLRPLPANHHAAHTTIRILGKLGGRNRRLLYKEPALGYRHHSDPAKMVISFGGSIERIELGPIADLARRMLVKGLPIERAYAYTFLECSISIVLHEGIQGRNAEETFVKTVEGLFDAIQIPDTEAQAEAYILKLAHALFDFDVRRGQTRGLGGRQPLSALLSGFLDALPYSLVREIPSQAKKAQETVTLIINDLISMSAANSSTLPAIIAILHQVANRFTALCLDDSWSHKSAGASGFKIMTHTRDLGIKWVADRAIDLVRTLLHVLKDLPRDLPRDAHDVTEVLLEVLRICNRDLDFSSESSREKLFAIVGVFFPELQSSNTIVRQAAQTAIELLVSLSGHPAVELLLPHRDRLLAGIYTKPLRALPFLKQIGMIEAVRYCVSLDPPLVELNDELLRLLHETLALADAEDSALLGRVTARQGTLEVIQLRVACIKLLTASMTLTDFFQRQHQTRQRVTGMYFKSLYSPSPEVKNVAHEGLKMVLVHQSRLPKELLQTGLRPILMNLADPKRLSVPGLEGLARLLELLVNYFKVEIGHKLLDHFRFVADPQMLLDSSRSHLPTHEGITKLVRLANIFHLLPAAADIFLDHLVDLIVQTEAQMHFSTCNPFSEPLGRYLDRYPVKGIDYFLEHINFPSHLQTLRSILQADLAPNLIRELASRTSYIVTNFVRGPDNTSTLSALLLLKDMATLLPTWIVENQFVVDAVLEVWHAEISHPEQSAVVVPEVIQRHKLMLEIFMEALKQSPRIDLIFEIVSIFTRNFGMDVVSTTHFLYQHVALNEDIFFRRNILIRFLTWFRDPSYSWSHKAYFIRYVVTAILLVQANRSNSHDELINSDFVAQVHRIIWRQVTEPQVIAETDDIFKIEVLHFTTVLVQHYARLLEDAKKDIIKCAWFFITSVDDIIVKQTAYLLAARFFAAFQTPQKFILRAWTGLLRSPHSEGRPAIRYEALTTLAPSLPRGDPGEPGHPQWAKTTRRLLAEEGLAQHITIYHLIVKQPQLFYPVRSLFVPHMANSLNKIGMSSTSTPDSRSLSIELLQVIFNWEEQATQAARTAAAAMDDGNQQEVWLTPLGFRENMLSYLVRLATMSFDAANKSILPRALSLLQMLVSPNGWTDVTVGLRFFSRALEQSELVGEQALNQALAAAKVLQVITAEQNDTWYHANAEILHKLIRKGMMTDESGLHDALHPIFEHLIKLFALPKEDEEQTNELSEFHNFVYSTVGDGLRNSTSLRGTLMMLKSIVQVTPERIEHFSPHLMKLLGKLSKEHIQSPASSTTFENNVRLLRAILEICQISVAFLADQRRWFLSTLVALVEKSKSVALCRYMLDLARTWALPKQSETYPTMKEKASLLQKMVIFETRAESLFHLYLELIYEIYTEPSLRRSDLTTRLENSFLVGCRAKDPAIRERFLDLFDVSVPRSLLSRLTYILGVQSWDALADYNWIYLALHLILGAADSDVLLPQNNRPNFPGTSLIPRPKTHVVVKPIQRLLFLDPQAAHDMWISVFPAVWSCLSRREQADITHHMINLLSKDYHIKQAYLRPNIIQTLLAGIQACSPPMTLPPHLIKFLAKTFGAWHVSLEILSASFDQIKDDEPTMRDYIYDSLADVYAELAEEDMFYGLWRRRCLHQDTNAALAFEQNGMWEQAQIAYESAQGKARMGSIPFSESEYCLWEDHWILAAEKLQHWDLLYDLARSEGNQELMLESAWRTVDWAEKRETLEEQISQLPEVPTPRRRVYEAFIALLKFPNALDKNVEFTRILEDAMQLSLRKWAGLPLHLSAAHVPLLQHFQQFVELQEAVQIFGSLSQTNSSNLEKKSSELKMVLQAWRERLPNPYDDISIWSDLVAWRQNVFHCINNAYIPLIAPAGQASGAAAGNTNTYGYRGYHETAWIINRFAHVARKHELLDVCFTSLTKIYTLPNIEISEAFLKLREQARCHYQKPNDLQAGLEVINNTNLVFFSPSQKAEFHTLKGMFHARFGRNEEADHAFGQAVHLDMTQGKVWAEWGRFNDRLFKENPANLTYAASAVNCYLQAAGQYKSGKSRPLIARILWFLSLDDHTFAISRVFDTYKGEAAFWYWISLIPQLCISIQHREVKQARYVLLNLAKLYPQALFYYLRTTREETQMMRKVAEKAAASRAANQMIIDVPNLPEVNSECTGNVQPAMANAQTPGPDNTNSAIATSHPSGTDPPASIRQPWEYVEEVLQVLKTTWPLLILSLETMIDQIQHKFKLSPEEDIYRNICMLLQDAVQNYVLRMNTLDDDGLMAPHTIQTLNRMELNMPDHVKKEYREDFITSKPTHNEYIQKLQQWRDKYENLLDSRPRLQPLAVLSHYLTEFHYSKVDEIEIPGQYTEDKDTNQNFVKIQKFAPKFENCRSSGTCWKRFTLDGSDNSKTSFAVQVPVHRQYRREDRVVQLFRTFNGALSRKKESRKRNLSFHLPAIISCSPSVRLLQIDSSYTPLGDVFELYCQTIGISKEEPILFAGDKVRKVLREFRQPSSRVLTKVEYVTLKKDVYDEVVAKWVPDNIITSYMSRTMTDASELWRMRKQFTLQLASCSFMTHVLCLSSRTPFRFHVSRSTGLIAMSELLPGISNQAPVFATNDVVPFRLTPNMQHFLGPIFIEGLLTSGIMNIGRCLTEPEFELEQQLCLFGRDEVISWMLMRGRPFQVDQAFRQNVATCIEGVVKRAESMACKTEREQAVNHGAMGPPPVIQTVTNLISSATNPVQLAKMGETYLPWF